MAEKTRLTRQGRVILAVLCLSLLIVSLDNTVLNVALPTIVRDLHATDTDLQWIVDAYALVFAGLLLSAGSLGDRIGRKWVYLVGLGVFAVGSAAAAFSGSPPHLTAARAVMGIGAAGIMPSTLSILTNVFQEEVERRRVIAIWSGTIGLGISLGPIVGGWLLSNFWWGSVFLINVPIAIAAAIAAAIFVPNSRNDRPKAPDLLGAALSLTGLGALLWGIIEAPQRSWTSASVLATICVGLSLLALFVLHERRSSHPMLPIDFFANRRFSVAIVAMGLVIFALMGSLFVLTQFLQFHLGYSALATGLRIGPIALVILVAAPLSAPLVQRVGTKVVVTVGMGLVAVGLFMLSWTSVAGGYLDALAAFMLLGIGTSLAFAPSTESVMGSLPLEQTGVGSATNSTSLQVGGALGVAVLGSLLNTRYRGMLTPLLRPYAMPTTARHTILGSLGGALAVARRAGSIATLLAGAAHRAFVSGLDLAMRVGAGAAAVGAIVALLTLPSWSTARQVSGRDAAPEHRLADAPVSDQDLSSRP